MICRGTMVCVKGDVIATVSKDDSSVPIAGDLKGDVKGDLKGDSKGDLKSGRQRRTSIQTRSMFVQTSAGDTFTSPFFVVGPAVLECVTANADVLVFAQRPTLKAAEDRVSQMERASAMAMHKPVPFKYNDTLPLPPACKFQVNSVESLVASVRVGRKNVEDPSQNNLMELPKDLFKAVGKPAGGTATGTGTATSGGMFNYDSFSSMTILAPAKSETKGSDENEPLLGIGIVPKGQDSKLLSNSQNIVLNPTFVKKSSLTSPIKTGDSPSKAASSTGQDVSLHSRPGSNIHSVSLSKPRGSSPTKDDNAPAPKESKNSNLDGIRKGKSSWN